MERVESSPQTGTEHSAIPSDVAGMAGLEPANAGVKVPCLTTWLHPNVFYGVDSGIRTHDLQGHNLAL